MAKKKPAKVKSKKQVAFLLSDRSPLSDKQKENLRVELGGSKKGKIMKKKVVVSKNKRNERGIRVIG